jgi:DNA-binding response OmpR family regulator
MKPTILIVEDNVIIAHHLKLLMTSVGFETFSLASGEEVDQFVKNNKPDVIFMDIMLAGEMSGIDATKQLRTHSEVPVIFMSALTDNESKVNLELISNIYSIQKPFDEVEIIKLTNSLTKVRH